MKFPDDPPVNIKSQHRSDFYITIPADGIL